MAEPTMRRVTLPNGKVIELIALSDDSTTIREAGQNVSPTSSPIHVCPRCHGDRVYPTDWEECGPCHWEVHLRCPDCEWRNPEGDLYDEDEVKAFDEELDRGTETLVHDLRRLMRANMEDEIERFVAALWAGHIVPMDF